VLLSARDLTAQQPKDDRHGGDHGHERHDHHHR
jgi:Flp pilus assembly protein TadB